MYLGLLFLMIFVRLQADTYCIGLFWRIGPKGRGEPNTFLTFILHYLIGCLHQYLTNIYNCLSVATLGIIYYTGTGV